MHMCIIIYHFIFCFFACFYLTQEDGNFVPGYFTKFSDLINKTVFSEHSACAQPSTLNLVFAKYSYSGI
jgi:hypothetical protein